MTALLTGQVIPGPSPVAAAAAAAADHARTEAAAATARRDTDLMDIGIVPRLPNEDRITAVRSRHRSALRAERRARGTEV